MVDSFFNSIVTAPIDLVGPSREPNLQRREGIVGGVVNTGKDVVNEVYKARPVVTTVGDIGKGVVDSGKGLVAVC